MSAFACSVRRICVRHWASWTETHAVRFLTRCQRSLTCLACGAPFLMADAYSDEPSRLTTSMEGWSRNHASTISTAPDAQFASKVCPCLTPRGESQLAERLLQSLRALSVRATEIWKPFTKNLLSTGALFTKEATYMHDETDGTPNRGKITERACIVTLDARRCSPTRGAQSHWGYRTQGQYDLLGYFYSLHFDVGKI